MKVLNGVDCSLRGAIREQISFEILSMSAPSRISRLSMCTTSWAGAAGCGGLEVMKSLAFSMAAAAVTETRKESASFWLSSLILGVMWGFIVVC